MCDLFTDLRGS